MAKDLKLYQLFPTLVLGDVERLSLAARPPQGVDIYCFVDDDFDPLMDLNRDCFTFHLYPVADARKSLARLRLFLGFLRMARTHDLNVMLHWPDPPGQGAIIAAVAHIMDRDLVSVDQAFADVNGLYRLSPLTEAARFLLDDLDQALRPEGDI